MYSNIDSEELFYVHENNFICDHSVIRVDEKKNQKKWTKLLWTLNLKWKSKSQRLRYEWNSNLFIFPESSGISC